MGAGGRVEGTQRDRGPVQVRRIPEQHRAADAAEAAADLVGGLEPGDLVQARYGQAVARDIGRGPVMAGLAAALDAMAGIARTQFTLDLEADRATEAGALVHHRFPAGGARQSTCSSTPSRVVRPAGTATAADDTGRAWSGGWRSSRREVRAAQSSAMRASTWRPGASS